MSRDLDKLHVTSIVTPVLEAFIEEVSAKAETAIGYVGGTYFFDVNITEWHCLGNIQFVFSYDRKDLDVDFKQLIGIEELYDITDKDIKDRLAVYLDTYKDLIVAFLDSLDCIRRTKSENG